MNNFVKQAAGPGATMWVGSISRTLNVPIQAVVHGYDDAMLALWWGPVVPVRRGDRVCYMSTPHGILVDHVESAQ